MYRKILNKQEIIDKLRPLAGKKSIRDISAEIGVDVDVLKNLACKSGISYAMKRMETDKEVMIKEAITKYGKDHSAHWIAGKIGVSSSTVVRISERMNFQIKKRMFAARDYSDGKFFNYKEHENWLF